MTLCFAGHRIIRRKDMALLPQRLDALLEACYEKGYVQYLCGGAIGFDTLAAEAVVRLRQKHGDVQLVLMIPCSDQSARWTQAQCQRYERLLYRANDVQVLTDLYHDGCMQARNDAMLARSSLCISYQYMNRGGTLSTVRQAHRMNIPVLNVALEQSCAAFMAGACFASDELPF